MASESFEVGTVIGLEMESGHMTHQIKYIVQQMYNERYLIVSPVDVSVCEFAYTFVDIETMTAHVDNIRSDVIDTINIFNKSASAVKTIHIPWIHKNTTEECIAQGFNNLGWGVVESVDLIKKTDNENQYGFVHFSSVTPAFEPIDSYLNENKENQKKIYYNGTNHWIVKAGTNNIVDRFFGKRLILDFSDDESDSEGEDEEE